MQCGSVLSTKHRGGEEEGVKSVVFISVGHDPLGGGVISRLLATKNVFNIRAANQIKGPEISQQQSESRATEFWRSLGD